MFLLDLVRFLVGNNATELLLLSLAVQAFPAPFAITAWVSTCSVVVQFLEGEAVTEARSDSLVQRLLWIAVLAPLGVVAKAAPVVLLSLAPAWVQPGADVDMLLVVAVLLAIKPLFELPISLLRNRVSLETLSVPMWVGLVLMGAGGAALLSLVLPSIAGTTAASSLSSFTASSGTLPWLMAFVGVPMLQAALLRSDSVTGLHLPGLVAALSLALAVYMGELQTLWLTRSPVRLIGWAVALGVTEALRQSVSTWTARRRLFGLDGAPLADHAAVLLMVIGVLFLRGTGRVLQPTALAAMAAVLGRLLYAYGYGLGF